MLLNLPLSVKIFALLFFLNLFINLFSLCLDIEKFFNFFEFLFSNKGIGLIKGLLYI